MAASTPISITIANPSFTTSTANYTFAVDARRKTLREQSFEKHMNLPIKEGYDGPVYMNDNYYAGVDEAIDACVDNDEHPAFAIAYPCTEDKVPVPGVDEILGWVDEMWAENFDDFDGPDWTSATKRAAENLVVALQQQAPVAWNADLKHRIVLAELDPDQEYDPDEDTYE